MALKRKRSSPVVSISSPSSSSTNSDATTTSSPNPLPFFYTHSKPLEPLHHKPTWSFPTYDDSTSRHLNSRTRKRFRDGRPEEGVVFEQTMNRLYNAQRAHPHATPISPPSPQIATPVQPQRSTLHSFWRISQQPPSTIPMVLDHTHMDVQQDTRCEDCDGPLRHDEAMEIDEEVYARETSCFACRRRVCDTCAVTGDRRVCLGCASGR